MKKLLMLILATAISGTVSALLPVSLPYSVYYAIGIYFGLSTAIILIAFYKLRPLLGLCWIGASTLSWYLAVNCFLIISGGLIDDSPVTYLAAGAVGSLMLAVSFCIFVRRDGLAGIPLIVVIGTVAGLAMYLIDYTFLPGFSYSSILSFIIWQTSVAAALVSDLPLKTIKRL